MATCAPTSIAAASILAKVERDRRMEEYDQLYPQYGLAQHKGYGTPDHLAALRRHGPTPLHRFSYAPVREAGCWSAGAHAELPAIDASISSSERLKGHSLRRRAGRPRGRSGRRRFRQRPRVVLGYYRDLPCYPLRHHDASPRIDPSFSPMLTFHLYRLLGRREGSAGRLRGWGSAKAPWHSTRTRRSRTR